jgi:hypothetical protein
MLNKNHDTQIHTRLQYSQWRNETSVIQSSRLEVAAAVSSTKTVHYQAFGSSK